MSSGDRLGLSRWLEAVPANPELGGGDAHASSSVVKYGTELDTFPLAGLRRGAWAGVVDVRKASSEAPAGLNPS